MSGTNLGVSNIAVNEADRNVFLCGASWKVESGDNTNNITYHHRR